MKICVLQGSTRHQSNTAELLKPFEGELRALGAEVEHIDLADKRINPCTGCCRCQTVMDLYGCAQKDDMQGIVRSILRAKALIFATPIYTWQVTPCMKMVMDRMYGLNKIYGGVPRQTLNKDQYYGLIATCGYDIQYGAGLVDEVMRRWCTQSKLQYLGMYAVRDEDDLASFQAMGAVHGARFYARRVMAAVNGEWIDEPSKNDEPSLVRHWNLMEDENEEGIRDEEQPFFRIRDEELASLRRYSFM